MARRGIFVAGSLLMDTMGSTTGAIGGASRGTKGAALKLLFVKWPRRWAFPTYGMLLALGAPLGLLLLRSILFGFAPWGLWVSGELHGEFMTYVYEWVTTSVAFATLGIVIGRTQDKLRATALTDSLTQLANRRHFYLRLSDEMHRAWRYDSPLSLLFIDLDGLKGINDRYGHEGGDLAIRSVSEALRLACRQTDLVARLGGDEFAVIAPQTRAADAVALAERIRTTLNKVRERTTLAQLSVSIGVAPFDAAFATTAAFCEAADSALYAAKGAGRDRVQLWPESDAVIVPAGASSHINNEDEETGEEDEEPRAMFF